MKPDPNEYCECSLLSGRWNPYLVGAGIGILSMAVFSSADTDHAGAGGSGMATNLAAALTARTPP
jgi:hypothetical protein